MAGSVWVNGSGPDPDDVLPVKVVADPIAGLHVTVDSMPASGSGLTDAELRATPVPISGTVTIQDAGGPITVDGTVTVTGVATAANQLPDGHNVTVDNASIAVTAAALPLPSGAATAALQLADGHNVTVDNASGGAAVNIQDGGNSITIDGTVAVSGEVDVTPASPAAATYLPVRLTDGSGFYSAEPGGGGGGLEYVYEIPSQVHVAAANTVHWDLFNADATLVVRVMGIYQKPNIVTAVTGVAFAWLLERTTAVGTGGTVITAWLPDTTQTAMDADITMRSKPTGGATQSTDLANYTIHSEETNAATQMMHMMMAGGVANLVPPHLVESGTGIVLRQNQGIRCVQVTNSNAGNTGWCICIMVE